METVYPVDNRKPLKVFLAPSRNVQSLGFPGEISSGDFTVDRWGENEVRVRNQRKWLSQENGGQKGESRVKVHFKSKTARTQ